MKVNISKLTLGLKAGDRASLARALTIVESNKPDDWPLKKELMGSIIPAQKQCTRIGISGPPGVGKSTIIEKLGCFLVEQEKSVAVLAIDPVSPRSKGSILGDKTRMTKLSKHERAFVRGTSAKGLLGGVSIGTIEAIMLCEAAGYDVVIVETVGVGQSEITVLGMVDHYIVVAQPGSGDELQALKRGIIEVADIIVVNKADGDLLALAKKTKRYLAQALSMMRAGNEKDRIQVILASALLGDGIEAIWKEIILREKSFDQSRNLNRRRGDQLENWFWQTLSSRIIDQYQSKYKNNKEMKKLIASVRKCETSVFEGAEKALQFI